MGGCLPVDLGCGYPQDGPRGGCPPGRSAGRLPKGRAGGQLPPYENKGVFIIYFKHIQIY